MNQHVPNKSADLLKKIGLMGTVFLHHIHYSYYHTLSSSTNCIADICNSYYFRIEQQAREVFDGFGNALKFIWITRDGVRGSCLLVKINMRLLKSSIPRDSTFHTQGYHRN